MQRLTSPAGARVSYDQYGSGPPLVLVYGAFNDHQTNWACVKPLFEAQFTVYAIARRGRGETDATAGHSREDEGRDVVAVVQSIGEPVFLLGHSYGAQTALAAAAQVPDRVRKLVLYEPAWPRVVGREALARLEALAQAGDWEGFAVTFFRDSLSVPVEVLDELRSTERRRSRAFCSRRREGPLSSRSFASGVPNPALKRTVQKLRCWVPSALRAPAAGELRRSAAGRRPSVTRTLGSACP